MIILWTGNRFKYQARPQSFSLFSQKEAKSSCAFYKICQGDRMILVKQSWISMHTPALLSWKILALFFMACSKNLLKLELNFSQMSLVSFDNYFLAIFQVMERVQEFNNLKQRDTYKFNNLRSFSSSIFNSVYCGVFLYLSHLGCSFQFFTLNSSQILQMRSRAFLMSPYYSSIQQLTSLGMMFLFFQYKAKIYM